MKLSPELRARAEAVEKHPNYQGKDLSNTVILSIEAPFATGKSTVTEKAIDMLASIGISAGLIGSHMTRQHRPGDPEYYTTGINPEQLIQEGERGELINLTIHPTTEELYATNADSIPHDVNIGPLLPEATQKFRDAGCKAVHAFYLTTTPDQWQKQLDKDGRLSQSDATKRIDEAIQSLEYALNESENPAIGDHHLIFVNNDGSRSIEQLAGTILYHAGFEEFEQYYTYMPHYVHEMYNHAVLLKQKAEEAA